MVAALETHVFLSYFSLFMNPHVTKSYPSTWVGMHAEAYPLLQANSPLKVAMRALPLLYGSSVGIVLSLVLIKAEPTRAWPVWLVAVVTLVVAVAVVVVVQLLLVPQLWQKIHRTAPSDLSGEDAAGSREAKLSVL